MKKRQDSTVKLRFPESMPPEVREQFTNGELNVDQDGDTLFHKTVPVHPMVAIFIALPVKKNPSHDPLEIRLVPPENTLKIQAGTFYRKFQKDTGKWGPLGVPCGMHARRLLMYIFSQVHLHNNVIMMPLVSSNKQMLETFGYRFTKSQQGKHPIGLEFAKLQKALIQFVHPPDNVKAGYDLSKWSDNIFAIWRDEEGKYDKNLTYVNPNFMFRVGFPVDFKHVIGTRKKSQFWNVYMFLVSVLPIIPKGRKISLTWNLMHRIFQFRYKTIENFRYYFKKTADEVYEIYPKAKEKVNASRSDLLVLRHAPPPI